MSDAPSHFSFSPHPNRAAEIPWREWGPEAFAQARSEDRPVFLSVSAWWCAAAHVLDETAYSDAAVIDLLATRFVPVRVDVDERPDVAARYGDGNTPFLAFLTPEGDVIRALPAGTAETLLAVAARLLDQWRLHRDSVVQQVETGRATRAAERAAARAQRGPGVLTPAILDLAVEQVDARYDEALPAVVEEGDPLRLPQVPALRLWRYAHHRRGHPGALDRVRATWRAMSEGGLFDHIEGGVFRASDAPDWSRPHHEKLARDQGALLQLAAEIAITDLDWRDEQREVAGRIVAYLDGTLGDARGGIGHAQQTDATYYAADEVERARHVRPPVDDRVFTASCAVAARGLIAAGVAFDRRDWMDRGLRAVDFLLAYTRAGQAGMYHAYDSGPYLLGILDDQAQMLLALLEAYEVTGLPSYLEHGRWLGRVMDDGWLDPGLGFRDVAFDHEDTALLAEPVVPLTTNIAAAEGFLWLARLTHDERYLGIASDTLALFAHGIEARGLAVADYARVVDRLLSAEPEFKIVSEWPAGEPDRVADPLHRAALRLPLAARTVQRLNPEQDDLLFYALGLPRDVVKVAYVCSGHTCSQPVVLPEALLGAVDEVLAAPSW